MRPAQNWNDYELIDATAGNRLERWDKAVLVRPDPQVVWKREPADPRWQQALDIVGKEHFAECSRTSFIPEDKTSRTDVLHYFLPVITATV